MAKFKRKRKKIPQGLKKAHIINYFMNIQKEWGCNSCGKLCCDDERDYYMVKHEVWKRIHPQIVGMLCMDCCEEKLGRKLIADDILIAPLTTQDNPYTRAILLEAGYKI